jgi:5-methylthioadenosine/S-adenosylhomocysteine deaminase
MRQKGQMKSDQIVISGPERGASIAGIYSVPGVSSLLVHGDMVLRAADAPPLRDAAVLVRDGAIVAVGDRDELRRAHPGVAEAGGDGMLVLPGLINAHHHGMAISSVQLGYPDPGPPEPGVLDTAFESWMATMLGLDAVDPYLGTLAKNVLLIESGVTAHLHMHFPSGAGEGAFDEAYAAELRATLRAHRDSGQRVALAPHWSDRSKLAYDGDDAFIAALPPELQRPARRAARPRMSGDSYIATIRELHRELRDDPLLSAQFAIMAPQWASDDLVESVGAAAAELEAHVHLHALESPLQRAWDQAFAGGRELERLERARILGERSAVAHGVWLSEPDIAILARTGSAVVHNCSSNLRLATGVAPLRRLVSAGVRVALGLDDMGAADDDDMFAEVRMAHLMQRVRGEAAHPRLTAAAVYGLMWEGGAGVVGAHGAIGRLEPGRRGDLAVVDLKALSAPYAVGDVDIWELLLARGKAAQVDTVIVEGRVLMQGRRLLHLDREAIMAEVAAAAAHAVARRTPEGTAWVARMGREIAAHYQAPVWHRR